LNAGTGLDLTVYFWSMPQSRLERWAWLESWPLADVAPREFYRERDVVNEERRMRTATANFRLLTVYLHLAVPGASLSSCRCEFRAVQELAASGIANCRIGASSVAARARRPAQGGWLGCWTVAFPLGADDLERSLYPFCPRPGFQKRLGQLSQRPTAEFSTQAQFFAEFFAELRAIGTPNPPVYSSVRG
jgi:hypothetical protein